MRRPKDRETRQAIAIRRETEDDNHPDLGPGDKLGAVPGVSPSPHGTGLAMIYKRLEKQGVAWPAVHDGTMRLDHARFEALFAGLDWRRVRALSVRPPADAE